MINIYLSSTHILQIIFFYSPLLKPTSGGMYSSSPLLGPAFAAAAEPGSSVNCGTRSFTASMRLFRRTAAPTATRRAAAATPTSSLNQFSSFTFFFLLVGVLQRTSPVVSHVAAKSRSPYPRCFWRKAMQCPAAILWQVPSVFAPLIAATTAVPLHAENTRRWSVSVLGVRGGDSPQRSGARSHKGEDIVQKDRSRTCTSS